MKKFLLAGVAALAIGSALAQTNAPPGPPTICTSAAVYDASTAGITQLVAARTGAKVYICGFILWSGASANHLGLVQGTGTNCATGQSNLTPLFHVSSPQGIVDSSPFNRGLITSDSQAVCIRSVSSVSSTGLLLYGQYLSQ